MYYIQDKQCFVVNSLSASDVVKQQKLSVHHPLVYQIILIRKKTLLSALNLEALRVAADTLVPRFIYTCKVCNSTYLYLPVIVPCYRIHVVIEYTIPKFTLNKQQIIKAFTTKAKDMQLNLRETQETYNYQNLQF
ncbi:Hypothetical_protein [Hexamita inflata]|uniref:Hypothetical_protein n=1 Tax=Hexamita inflata TaxID=28002 RepID=A0AA86PJ60_9EUKA|nr:Hypothetical protein HINF_LOCUS27088 [Hexamita inflata]